MKDYKYYLDTIGEIGFIEKINTPVVYVSGLPKVKQSEVVLFEDGQIGQVLAVDEEYVEVLLLLPSRIKSGIKAVRTNETLSVAVGKELLGQTINPLGVTLDSDKTYKRPKIRRPLFSAPPAISMRKSIAAPLVTGVGIVDMIVSLGKGQRELIVGDRKTGKTQFLLQTVLSQVLEGTICVYAAIAKSSVDIAKYEEFFRVRGVLDKTVIVASSLTDSSGMIFLTPYSAMTIAEYFRDMGMNVLVILDDLIAHAAYYREIALLGKRFPGRDSYPGDIFFVHARLMERAGNFLLISKDSKGKLVQKEASISCLSVAELALGDLTGYIQTNLMAMTDGHIYFDLDLYNQGRRPAINPFLSVTRVGRQAQTPLLRDLSRVVTSFLVELEQNKQFMHFGAELTEATKRIISLGQRVEMFFQQASDVIVPVNINILIISLLWSGKWIDSDIGSFHNEIQKIRDTYVNKFDYKKKVDNLISSQDSFVAFVSAFKSGQLNSFDYDLTK